MPTQLATTADASRFSIQLETWLTRFSPGARIVRESFGSWWRDGAIRWRISGSITTKLLSRESPFLVLIPPRSLGQLSLQRAILASSQRSLAELRQRLENKAHMEGCMAARNEPAHAPQVEQARFPLGETKRPGIEVQKTMDESDAPIVECEQAACVGPPHGFPPDDHLKQPPALDSAKASNTHLLHPS